MIGVGFPRKSNESLSVGCAIAHHSLTEFLFYLWSAVRNEPKAHIRWSNIVVWSECKWLDSTAIHLNFWVTLPGKEKENEKNNAFLHAQRFLLRKNDAK